MWLYLGRNFFLLIFPLFYRFDPKKLFKQIQIFLRISPFSNMLRKTNFLSISMLFSERVTFLSQKRISLWILQKYFKTKEKHSLAECGSLWEEKLFLLMFVPYTGLIKKRCLNKSKFSSGYSPFQTY